MSPKAIFMMSGMSLAVLVWGGQTRLGADSLVKEGARAVKDKAGQKVYAFDLGEVRLGEGPFKAAMERDAAYLMRLEPDRLLSRYREYAGLKPKGEAYGGWERATISGHTLGHYMTAIAKLYACNRDERLRERMRYIVGELAACQEAWGNGFVGGFPKSREVFGQIKAGDIRTKGFDLNGLWVPWYNLHKLYMGLVDVYRYGGVKDALGILRKVTDWAWETVEGLSDEQFETMLHCEHGGINEAFAEIYAVTGEEKALRLAERFYHHRVLDPLARREDRLTGLHGNTQIPKVIGLARLYRLTGKEAYLTAARFFWERVTQHRSYANGGNTDGEYFFSPEEFSQHLSVHTTETCNTYNMLKLTRQLFAVGPGAAYADYYERALYNHILASQDPREGMMFYFCPLKSGHFKTYNSPFDSFWCCTGTGMENHVKYGDSIYFYDKDTLYVNLFIPSELRYRAKGMTVTQQTQYPLSGEVQMRLSAEAPVRLALKIRRPGWATGPVKLTVNGREEAVKAGPGEYLTVERKWEGRSEIRLELPMALRTEVLPGEEKKVAFFYGPVLLAGALGMEGVEGIDWYVQERGKYDQVAAPSTPVLVAEEGPVDSYIRAGSRPGTFIIKGEALRTLGTDKRTDVTLVPFYQMHYQRYMVYWDRFSEAAWKAEQERYEAEQARRQAEAARTIDQIVPGQMQPERDHHFQGEKTNQGVFRNRHWRDARDGGWFSFEMKVRSEGPVELACLYWGSDGPGRDFDILVDGTKIATEHLNRNQPGRFFSVVYDIPAALTGGKEKVTVKFQGHRQRMAGGVFECRTMRKEP